MYKDEPYPSIEGLNSMVYFSRKSYRNYPFFVNENTVINFSKESYSNGTIFISVNTITRNSKGVPTSISSTDLNSFDASGAMPCIKKVNSQTFVICSYSTDYGKARIRVVKFNNNWTNYELIQNETDLNFYGNDNRQLIVDDNYAILLVSWSSTSSSTFGYSLCAWKINDSSCTVTSKGAQFGEDLYNEYIGIFPIGNHKFYLGSPYYGYKILNAESFNVDFSNFTHPSSANAYYLSNVNLNEEYIYIDGCYYTISFRQNNSGESTVFVIKSSNTNIESFTHAIKGLYYLSVQTSFYISLEKREAYLIVPFAKSASSSDTTTGLLTFNLDDLLKNTNETIVPKNIGATAEGNLLKQSNAGYYLYNNILSYAYESSSLTSISIYPKITNVVSPYIAGVSLEDKNAGSYVKIISA